jgi:hypothetical protein
MLVLVMNKHARKISGKNKHSPYMKIHHQVSQLLEGRQKHTQTFLGFKLRRRMFRLYNEQIIGEKERILKEVDVAQSKHCTDFSGEP